MKKTAAILCALLVISVTGCGSRNAGSYVEALTIDGSPAHGVVEITRGECLGSVPIYKIKVGRQFKELQLSVLVHDEMVLNNYMSFKWSCSVKCRDYAGGVCDVSKFEISDIKPMDGDRISQGPDAAVMKMVGYHGDVLCICGRLGAYPGEFRVTPLAAVEMNK